MHVAMYIIPKCKTFGRLHEIPKLLLFSYCSSVEEESLLLPRFRQCADCPRSVLAALGRASRKINCRTAQHTFGRNSVEAHKLLVVVADHAIEDSEVSWPEMFGGCIADRYDSAPILRYRHRG